MVFQNRLLRSKYSEAINMLHLTSTDGSMLHGDVFKF